MPTATYDLIASNTLTSQASSVTFSSIPSTYRDLVLVVQGRSVDGTNDNFVLRFNGDTGSNYNYTWGEGYGNLNTYAASSLSATWIILGQAYSVADPDYGGMTLVNLFDYAQTDKHKSFLARSGNPKETFGVSMFAGRWVNTTAITSITVLSTFSSFKAGTTYNLYGIAG